MLEMKLVIAMVAQQFDFELLPDQEVHPVAALTPSPNGPISVKLAAGSAGA